MSDLFRPEAVEHAQKRLRGEVVIAAPLPVSILLGGIIAIVLGAIAFAGVASYARKQTVQGWLVPDAGLVRVTAARGGWVRSIVVKEGGDVKEGTTLAVLRLSSSTLRGDAGAVLMHNLEAEGLANEELASANIDRLKSQVAELLDRREALKREAGETAGILTILRERRRLADEQVRRAEALARDGFVSKTSLEALKAAGLSIDQEIAERRVGLLALGRQVRDVDHQVETFGAEINAQAALREQGRAALGQRRVTLATDSEALSTAPVAGRVVAIPISRGQSVATGGTVAVLMPKGAELIAELYAPSRTSGFIRAGDEVRLMYQAYPYQRFGAGRGVVESVSPTVLAPSEVSIPALTFSEPVFRIRVKLERKTLRAYGDTIALQPGMLLTADIVTDRRTLLQWLFDPIYAAGRAK